MGGGGLSKPPKCGKENQKKRSGHGKNLKFYRIIHLYLFTPDFFKLRDVSQDSEQSADEEESFTKYFPSKSSRYKDLKDLLQEQLFLGVILSK